MTKYTPSNIKEELRKEAETPSYKEEINTSPTPFGIGLTTAALYLEDGGRKNIMDAYEIGSLIGANIKTVDDLLDGDGCRPVKNREKFLNNYIKALEEGKTQPVIENPDEEPAYKAAKMLHNKITELDQTKIEDIIMHAKDMRDLAKEEDKTKPKPYQKYVSVAGGMSGSFLEIGLSALEDHELDLINIERAFDLGYSGEIIDDLYDDDVEIDKELQEEMLNERLEHLEESDSTIGTLASKVAPIYNYFATFIEKSGDFLNKNEFEEHGSI